MHHPHRNTLGKLSDEAIDALEGVLLEAGKDGVSVHLSGDGKSVLAAGDPQRCRQLAETLRDRRLVGLSLAWVRARTAMTALVTRLTTRKGTQ
jgi:hypothetical protein